MVEYNGAMYRYVHNLQGDIVGIIDSAGSLVVEYKYDAWGKPIATTGNLKTSLGELNPFRYRGYVYDEEIGLYYLRSRYYNPEVGKFINADTVLGKVGGLCSHDAYAYCANMPVDAADPSGHLMLLIYETFFMDKQGGAIFSRWLNGFGKKLVIKNDTEWNNYFMKNKYFVSTVKKMTTDAMTQRRADNGSFSERSHLDLSGGNGGGYRTGYELINGTDSTVGDFELTGTIYYTNTANVYHVSATYTIHDQINPNFNYGFVEKAAYYYCKLSMLWFLGGYDYELEISGDIEFDVEWTLS